MTTGSGHRSTPLSSAVVSFPPATVKSGWRAGAPARRGKFGSWRSQLAAERSMPKFFEISFLHKISGIILFHLSTYLLTLLVRFLRHFFDR